MSSDTKTPSFEKLTESNYPTWADNMEARLSTKRLWLYVDGTKKEPDAKEADKLEEYKENMASAAGEIWLCLDPIQQEAVKAVRRDPKKLWEALQENHQPKQAGGRFNAYDALFSIRLLPGESLLALESRVRAAVQHLQALRPQSFTLELNDSELGIMSVLRALPREEYGHLVTSILLSKNPTSQDVHNALLTETSQRRDRAEPEVAPVAQDTAMFASSRQNRSQGRQQPPHQSSSHHHAQDDLFCECCEKPGHSTTSCRLLQRLKVADRARRQEAPAPAPTQKEKKKRRAQRAVEKDSDSERETAASTQELHRT